jgi:hypothetical protein
MANTSSPSAASKEKSSTTTPPPERIDSPLSFPYLIGLFATSFFPYRTPVLTIISLAISAAYSWLLFLHPYLPPAFTRTYSHLLTAGNLLLFSIALTLTIVISMIPAWWSGEGIPVEDFGKEDGMRYPTWVFICLDVAAHFGFSGRFWYDRWTKPKEKSDN